MLLVLPYSLRDQELALKLVQWISELGEKKAHSALIVRDKRCDPTKDAQIKAELEKNFQKVEVETAAAAFDSWAEGANHLFSAAGRYIEHTTKEPWLWLESDVVPMRANWVDALETEYKQAGKPFMGADVNVNNVPRHMSGVACYPGEMSKHAGLALISNEIPWDVQAADQIIPKAHFTQQIVHNWKHEPFKDKSELDNLRVQHPNCVLFHSDKSGSLIDLLRQERNGASIEMEVAAAPYSFFQLDGETVCGACDIFIKTHPPDYEWLVYALRSIKKFSSGFRRVVLMSEDTEIPDTDPNNLKIKAPLETEDGYLDQQVKKMYADFHTNADFILHTDSDCLFTKPITPQTFFRNGKPIWMMTRYGETDTPWKPITEKFMQRPVEFEFMRRHPQLVPRWLYAKFREYAFKTHGQPLCDYIKCQPLRAFSEFNALGAYAYEFHRDAFTWVDTAKDEWPELVLDQRRSWGGLTPEIKAEWDKILSDETPQPSARKRKPMSQATKDKIGARNRKHGAQSRKSLPLLRRAYAAWAKMKERCYDPQNNRFYTYGGRGIAVDNIWHDFRKFLQDMGYPPTTKHSIERLNNNANYGPGNCRWATLQEQANNRSNTVYLLVEGQTKTLREWSRETGIKPKSIWARYKHGKTGKALIAPVSGNEKSACL